MRWPSGPGYGGRSRPSESGPSRTHVTFLPIRALCRLEATAEKCGDGRRHTDAELHTGFAPDPIVAVHDGGRLGGELQQARRKIEIEMRERMLDGLEHALGGHGRAEHARAPI